MSTRLLETGLLIERENRLLELRVRLQNDLYFEDPTNLATVRLTHETFFEELQSGAIEIKPGFTSKNELQAQSDSSANDEQVASPFGIDERYQRELLRRLGYVKGVLARRITRGQLSLIEEAISEIALEMMDPRPPGRSTVSAWIMEYERNCRDITCLISGHSRRVRSAQTDEAHQRLISDVIEHEYMNSRRKSAATVYLAYVAAVAEENTRRKSVGLAPFEKISARTFYRRIDDIPAYDRTEAREGYHAARAKHHMTLGHLPADGVLDFVEIDHTVVNLYVVDDRLMLPLGRPYITVLKDRRSGVVLGFYVGFVPPSLESAFGAVKYSIFPHTQVRAMWPEIENDLPYGIGAIYVSDRAAEFRSPRFQLAIAALGADCLYNERRTPWHKGSIERFMWSMEGLLECMPGRTFRSLEVRGDYDPKKHAVIRFSTFCYLLHKWAADFHNLFPNGRKQTRPLDTWLELIARTPTVIPAEPAKLDIAFGMQASSMLTREGLTFRYLHYANDQLWELWNALGPRKDKHPFVLRTEDLGSVYVLDPRTKKYFEVPCTNQRYARGKSVFQHQMIRKVADVLLLRRDPEEALARATIKIQTTIGEELEAKATKDKRRLARFAGIDSTSVVNGTGRSIGDIAQRQDSKVAEDQPSPMPFTRVPMPLWEIQQDIAA